MLWAALIIFVSVGGGTLLAFLPRDRDAWVGPVRTFALTAALSVVVLHLLPEAMVHGGFWALLVFLAGLFAPEALGKAGAALFQLRSEARSVPADPKRRERVALEASYYGLLMHRVGDGVGLGAFTGEMQQWSGSQGVLAAMAAHAVPIVAIVVLTYDSLRGRDAALIRAAGLGLASMVGVILARVLPGEVFAEAGPWIAAFVGGMLLHVVSHDLMKQLPESAPSRAIDLLAGALGIAVSFLGGEAHGHDTEELGTGELLPALADLVGVVAPLFLLALFLGTAQRIWNRRPSKPSRPQKGGPVARGALFLVAQELAVETWILGLFMLGLRFALLRLIGAALLATMVAWFVSRQGGARDLSPRSTFSTSWSTERSWARRAIYSMDEQLRQGAAWLLSGVVIAALIASALPSHALLGIAPLWVQFTLITVVALSSRVSAAAAVPIALSLWEKGLSPGAVLLGLWLGPLGRAVPNWATRIQGGRRLVWSALAVACVLAWACAFLVAQGVPLPAPPGPQTPQEMSPGQIVAGLSCAVLLLRVVFIEGVRGFVATLRIGSAAEHEDSCAAHRPEP